MKSRTSFFNATALRKDITRFFPAWVLYGVFLLLCLSIITGFGTSRAEAAYALGETVNGMVVINFLYALLCAQLLFGDLYKSRMCNALHAFPLRREGWLCVHVSAGLLFSFVPNAIAALIAMPLLGQHWNVAPVWLLVSSLQYLFFFALAVFSAQCVGSRFALAMLYGICNFLSLIIAWMVNALYLPLLRGVVMDVSGFVRFCPVVQMMQSGYVRFTYVYQPLSRDYAGSFSLSDGWGYLGVCGAVALLLFVLAWLVYRRRKLECAGDFIAAAWLKPIFLVIYTLCAGAVCQMFFSLFVGNGVNAFLVIGILLGFFTGQMLLRRTVRVFQPKVLAQLVILVAALGASLLVTRLDPLGRVNYIPQAEAVARVEVSCTYGYGKMTGKDQTQIASVAALHAQLLDEAPDGKSDMTVNLTYTMKNGTVVRRAYRVDVDNAANADALRRILSDPSVFFGERADDPQALMRAVRWINCGWEEKSFAVPLAADRRALLEAFLRDCAEGNTAQSRLLQEEESVYTLEIQVGDAHTFYITIYPSCKNTVAWLEANIERLDEAK